MKSRPCRGSPPRLARPIRAMTRLPPWVMPLLRCPETGLAFHPADAGLVRADGRIFPDRDGIASLVFPAMPEGDDGEWNRFYDRIAPYYDFVERVIGRIITGIDMARGRQEIIDLLGLRPGMRLLEVSPGPGVFQPMLRRALGDAAEIGALDLSLDMLRQCRLRHDDLGVALIQGNAQHLPFADASFDALFHFGGVNLFNEPGRALGEFTRVVRKGGLLAWGDESMSADYRHPLGRALLPRMNPGFLKTPPAIPSSLPEAKTHEVYGGLGYLVVARR